MDWWLRVRRVPAVCASLVACLLLGALADSIHIPVPVVLGGVSFQMPLPFLLPLVPVCLILYGQSRGMSALEATAVRPVKRWDTGFMTACCLLAVTGGWSIASMTGHVLAAGMARNFLGYLGLALLLRPLIGHSVTAVAITLLPIGCAAFGVRNGRPHRWAWPLHEAASLPSFLVAVALAVTGIAVSLLPRAVTRRAHAEGG
ncbi:hypothetical protein ACFXAZ_05340 [Streptomyces sp. NPDC059477]|uniref:hypothetical protein n=1 Tax=Streptomyces sp. NPDC059477 TaxID=3346847 RepID=UPI0036901FD3